MPWCVQTHQDTSVFITLRVMPQTTRYPHKFQPHAEREEYGRCVQTLGLPTFCFLRDEVAVEHGLQFCPTSPQHEPAGSVVVFAVLMAAQTRQRETEVVDRHGKANFMITPHAQNFNVVGSEQRGGPSGFGVLAA